MHGDTGADIVGLARGTCQTVFEILVDFLFVPIVLKKQRNKEVITVSVRICIYYYPFFTIRMENVPRIQEKNV